MSRTAPDPGRERNSKRERETKNAILFLVSRSPVRDRSKERRKNERKGLTLARSLVFYDLVLVIHAAGDAHGGGGRPQLGERQP